MAGAVPLDAEGNLVGPGDFETQTRQALAAAGARTEQVVKTTVYVVAEQPADLARVWDVVAPPNSPGAPSTLLGVGCSAIRPARRDRGVAVLD